MAPSRGTAHHTTASSSSPNPSHTSTSHDDHDRAITQQSSTALAAARRNFSYLLNPTAAAATGASPTRLRTRALLRTLRYVSQFIFWRVVRYAKYAAVTALVAAVSASAIGSVVTGVAWIAAPPTIVTSVFASVVWGMGKFLAGRLHKRWERDGKDEGVKIREDVEDGRVAAGTVRSEGTYGLDVGPRAMPW